MSVPIIIAHGSLGAFDEIIFLGVGLIFLGMMGVSWLRSRNEAEFVDEETPAEPQDDTPDRFRLD